MFAGSHHRLHFGSDGYQAVAKAKELHPDVILMDIRMPGMDGRQAFAEIRKLPGLELVPIIAVTASTLLSEETDFRTRFSGYVRKPFSKSDLFDQLVQFLPRQENESRVKRENPEPAGDAPAGSSELLAELKRLAASEWPALRDSLAINECKAFAGTLNGLCQRWPCPAMEAYAQKLARYADSYSVVELEDHLNEFPSLVKRLEGAASA
jgi:CheY-like chemotaxis protein